MQNVGGNIGTTTINTFQFQKRVNRRVTWNQIRNLLVKWIDSGIIVAVNPKNSAAYRCVSIRRITVKFLACGLARFLFIFGHGARSAIFENWSFNDKPWDRSTLRPRLETITHELPEWCGLEEFSSDVCKRKMGISFCKFCKFSSFRLHERTGLVKSVDWILVNTFAEREALWI